MTTVLTPEARMAELIQNGFCIIEDVADEWLLNRTRACVDKALAEVDAERLAKTKSPGSLIDSNNYPELADLIGNPRALAELDRMGLKDIKFWKAVIISKPPGGPRLYWHQDWASWEDPISVTPWPQQIFVSYYLSDTSVENGCLKVTPGTHHKRISLHDELVPAHEQGARYIEEDHPVMFGDHPDQVDVCVRARSFVLADARLLHSARRNLTDERRTLILAWHRRRDEVWDKPPAYWEGEIPEVLANRDANREYARSRIPGEHLEFSGQ